MGFLLLECTCHQFSPLLNSEDCAVVRCRAPPEDCVDLVPADPERGICCAVCGEHMYLA